jgi:hypothetical protein
MAGADELTVELDCRVGQPDDFARLATAWLTEAKAELFPEYEAGLAAEPAAKGPDEKDPDAPWGPPHGLCAQMLVQRVPYGVNLRLARYSRRNWRRLLNGFAASPPYHFLLLLHPLNARGLPVEQENAVSVEFHRLPGDPEWASFAISAPAALVPWPGSEAIQRRWLDFLATWAVRLDASYGHLTDDADTVYGTALERVLNLPLDQTVPRCGETLRGYTWVTLCSPDVAGRLGGPEALRASGAFHEVTELPGGRLLLRATPRLEQYTGDTAARVLRALAPVLPHGRTGREYLHSWMRLVPDADAADYS